MEFFELLDGKSINLSKVNGFERLESGLTRIYIHLDDMVNYIDTELPYKVVKSVIVMKCKPKVMDTSVMERKLDQLAKYQTSYAG